MVHDMYLLQVKSPTESTDALGLLQGGAKVPGEQAFTTKAESQVRRS